MSDPDWEDVTRLVVGNSIMLGGNRVVIGKVQALRRERGYRFPQDIVVSGVMNGSVAVEIRFRDAKEVPRVEFSE